jgi:hypothetical protein
MLVGGALAGFLSGLILPFPLGLRGAIFGCGLSLALHLIQKFGWQRSYAYLPGLVIGVLLGLFPFELNLYQEPLPYRYDYFTLINSFITIPLFSCAFLTGTWKKEKLPPAAIRPHQLYPAVICIRTLCLGISKRHTQFPHRHASIPAPLDGSNATNISEN